MPDEVPPLTIVVTGHPTPQALRHDLEQQTASQPVATRWRIIDLVGGARVYDDAAGTVTDYYIREDWD